MEINESQRLSVNFHQDLKTKLILWNFQETIGDEKTVLPDKRLLEGRTINCKSRFSRI